jgi:pimeloyl-ACP methyl ester carboxylesterase
MLLTTLGGSAAYVLCSYLMMRRHTARRPFWTALRDVLYEVGHTAATQPLLPFFYLGGRRLGCRKDSGRPVILIHGYGQNRGCFWWLARQLQERGIGPLYGLNYPWFLGIDDAADRLAELIDEVLAHSQEREVDLVCHSMGGLVALDYLRRAGARARVRRCVTVASPHGGVTWSGPIPGACGEQMRRGCVYLQQMAENRLTVPVLSIYSTHDNIVYPPATSSIVNRGGQDACVPSGGHLSLLFSRRVATMITDFLDEPTTPETVERPLAEVVELTRADQTAEPDSTAPLAA